MPTSFLSAQGPNPGLQRRECLVMLAAALPAWGQAQPASAAVQQWEQARQRAEQAQGMASRIVSTMNGLADQVERLLARRESLRTQSTDLAADLNRLKRRNEGLLDEYRNGLFCSGCGQTRSQILAKGETFPHANQTVLRPSAEQIRSKERDLARQEQELSTRLDTLRQDAAAVDTRARAGVEQLGQGIALWRCAFSDASAQLNRALSLRRRQMDEQQQALRDQRDQLSARAAAAQLRGEARVHEALLADAGVQQRQLDKSLRESDQAISQGQAWLARSLELRRQQKAQLESYLDQRHLRLAAPAVSDALVASTSSALDLGAFYLLGSLPDSASAATSGPPTLAEVQDFVLHFKQQSANWLAGAAAGQPAAATAPSSSPRPAAGMADLLQKLP